ncbi:MAG: cupin domain-containing protein, partial [Bacteriovoracaceae bacterium]
WEFDDVMAVCSNKGMSLGAHIDNYNVFILQGAGKRKWQIQLEPNKSFKEGEEIKELEEFNPDFEWELEPGDMIYIPPHVAHHGVSLTESISYSIGFRALESYEVLRSYLHHLFEQRASPFFKGKKFNFSSQSDFDPEILNFLQEELLRISENQAELKSWLVSFLSSSKYPVEPLGEALSSELSAKEFQRDAQLKYVLSKESDEEYLLGINQKTYRLNKRQKDLLLPVLDSNPFETFQLTAEQEKELRAVLGELFEAGAIFTVDKV